MKVKPSNKNIAFENTEMGVEELHYAQVDFF